MFQMGLGYQNADPYPSNPSNPSIPINPSDNTSDQSLPGFL